MTQALLAWRRRGGGAPRPRIPIAYLEPQDLRGVYFTIYDHRELSAPAQRFVEEARQTEPSIDGYEGWTELPYNADLISLYWPQGGKPAYDRVWRRCTERDETPKGGRYPVQLVALAKHVLGRQFTANERKTLFDKYMGTLTEMHRERLQQKGDPNVIFGLDEVAERFAAAAART